jgi:hypothetical protein
VTVAGSDHIARTVIDLAEAATCEVVEEYSLGRSGEAAGRLVTDLRVVRSGRTLVRHGECFGPSHPGARTLAPLATAGHVLAGVFVGVAAGESLVELADPADPDGFAAAWLPVGDDAGVVPAAGPDRPSVSAAVARIMPSFVEALVDGQIVALPTDAADAAGISASTINNEDPDAE